MDTKDKIIKFSKQKLRSVFEIAEEFNIPKSQIDTLRRRVKVWGIKVKDMRGKKSVEW